MQTKHWVTANPRPSQPIWTVSPPEKAATIRIHHRHLLLLNPNAETHFTVPRRVEGWVDLGTAIDVRDPWPKVSIHRSGCCDKRWDSFEPWSSYTTERRVTTRPLRLLIIYIIYCFTSTTDHFACVYLDLLCTVTVIIGSVFSDYVVFYVMLYCCYFYSHLVLKFSSALFSCWQQSGFLFVQRQCHWQCSSRSTWSSSVRRDVVVWSTLPSRRWTRPHRTVVQALARSRTRRRSATSVAELRQSSARLPAVTDLGRRPAALVILAAASILHRRSAVAYSLHCTYILTLRTSKAPSTPATMSPKTATLSPKPATLSPKTATLSPQPATLLPKTQCRRFRRQCRPFLATLSLVWTGLNFWLQLKTRAQQVLR